MKHTSHNLPDWAEKEARKGERTMDKVGIACSIAEVILFWASRHPEQLTSWQVRSAQYALEALRRGHFFNLSINKGRAGLNSQL